jgi:Zn-dependent protease with chaperone function
LLDRLCLSPQKLKFLNSLNGKIGEMIMSYTVKKTETLLFAVKIVATVGLWTGIAYCLWATNVREYLATFFMAVFYGLVLSLYFWFYKVYLIAYMKGNGICLSEEQFPEVYRIYSEIAKELGLKKVPPLFIMQNGGILNAFAIRLSGKNYIALYADVFSQYKTDIDAVTFVLAHELGHVKRRHNQKRYWTMMSSIIPFLTAAYSRACEYTCDNIGSMFTKDGSAKLHGLLLLAGGKDIYQEINVDNYLKTAKQNRTFSVRFINLFISHPYLPNRIANIIRN